MGASEAIHAALPKEIIMERVSPVIYMRAQKNNVEREGMRRAHIRDAAAMCDTMSYLEERFAAGDHWTEQLLAREVDRSRRIQALNQGISRPTIVAYGAHSAHPYYQITNASDVPIGDGNIILIESGGQYLDGTTDVARTFHLGKPTSDQKKAYTNVLIGLIRLSMLVFPESLKPSEADAITRSPTWGTLKDYPHGTGHGIGSYLSVHECELKFEKS
jgi:Xaa-Pro aminopeptidase